MFSLDIAEFIKKLLGSQVRAALVLLAGILVTKGIIQPEHVDAFVGANVQIVLGGIIYLGTFAWNYFQKLKVQKVEDLAKKMAPQATASILKKLP